MDALDLKSIGIACVFSESSAAAGERDVCDLATRLLTLHLLIHKQGFLPLVISDTITGLICIKQKLSENVKSVVLGRKGGKSL